MVGIFFGVICTLALIRVASRGRFGRGRGGRRFFLRRLLRRLDTGPGQEKVVLGEIDRLQDTLLQLHASLRATRDDLAGIVRDETFDRSKVEALYAKQDALLAQLRASFASATENVHAVLDTRQRATLADMIAGGFRRSAFGGMR